MIITRKIEVYVCESDKDKRKICYEKLYDNRNVAVKCANMCVSHLFALDNSMPYLSQEDKEKIVFLGTKGNPATRQNAPYVAASEAFKGKADMSMVSSVLQNVQKMYKDDIKNGGLWNKSLRSYKSDMPVPFKKDRFLNMRFENYTDGEGNTKEGCFFTLLGIPFQMKFGRDRSNNRIIVKRIISGNYKMATSSLQFKGGKTFLLLCVDIPETDNSPVKGKKAYAFLGVLSPINCFISTSDDNDLSRMNICEIGTKDEFNHRRRQIQEAVRRCQIENKYSAGGKGHKRKTQAISRWHDKEKHYVDTKLHTYSRMLVNYAVKNRCDEIVLLNQTHREEQAKSDNLKGEPFVLRNWSYFGLKTKIEYKCKQNNIKLTIKE